MYALSAPFDVSLEITSSCNLKCIHCYSEAGKESENELDTEEWKNVIEELAELKVFRICISGEEPFCRKDIFELLSYANEFEFSIRITTNGTLIDENTVKKLSQLDNINLLHISLDGGSAYTHDYIRGVKGSFERVIRSAKLLKKYNINFIFGTTLTRYNYKEIEKIVNIANSFDVPVHFMQLMPTGRAKEKFKELALSPRELKEVENILTKVSKESKKVMWDNFCYKFERNLELSDLEKAIAGCRAGKTECVITSTGDVIPCDMFPRTSPYISGNIRRKKFKEIWKEGEIFRELRCITENTLKGKCSRCRFKSLCVGGCRAIALYLAGDYRSPDPLCPYI